MTFADPAVHARHAGRGPGGYATIEVGHAESRTGIIVQLDGVTTHDRVRLVLESAFDRAGRIRAHRVTDPGWWAALIAASALDVVGTASIQRTPARAAVHSILVVERGSMVNPRPLWPLARLRPSSSWLDLRGETALAVGPSDAELEAYARAAGIDVPTSELLRMFNFGVLEWESGDVRGRRRGLIHAGA